jgi:ADP-glucose pyrophosphorylase
MVISRSDLESIIDDSISHGYTDFTKDVLKRNMKKKLIRTHNYEGWYAYISSLESYFSVSMRLLTSEAREGLFGDRNNRIYTNIND